MSTKKKKKTTRTRILLPSNDAGVPAGSDLDEDGDGSGMFLEKEDVKLLYNALVSYTPTEEEKQLHSIWLEEFEEMLVVEYGEPYPDAN